MNEYECRYLFDKGPEKSFIEWIKSFRQKENKKKIGEEILRATYDTYQDFFMIGGK